MGPAKAKLNKQVHGVSFEDAVKVFADPFNVVHDNVYDHANNEQRYQAIGSTGSVVLVSVVFVDRSVPDLEVIHLISARKVDQYERSLYEDQFA
jgi:uncharacterized DUF497 family protein